MTPEIKEILIEMADLFRWVYGGHAREAMGLDDDIDPSELKASILDIGYRADKILSKEIEKEQEKC